MLQDVDEDLEEWREGEWLVGGWKYIMALDGWRIA